MSTIIIEHVALNELPASWRARIPTMTSARVTVRIEEEVESVELSELDASVDNPLFGMWQDREEMLDVSLYARQLRSPRF